MKYLVVLYVPDSVWQFKKEFPLPSGIKQSAFERSLLWAKALKSSAQSIATESIATESIATAQSQLNQSQLEKFAIGCDKIAIICDKNAKFAIENAKVAIESLKICDKDLVFSCDRPIATSGELIATLEDLSQSQGADFVVFANAASPVLDLPLTKRLLLTHTEYKAEYTFSDGYPGGFAPEIIDAGAVKIMKGLCSSVSAKVSKKEITKDSIFDIIKADINSFEIETEISSYDYRLLRLDFTCTSKRNFLAAKNLFQKLLSSNPSLLQIDNEKIGEENVLSISQAAREEVGVLKTVPAYYQVQIDGMESQKFFGLAEKIKAFSDDAYVSLSLFCEAAKNEELYLFVQKLKEQGLKTLIEISGSLLNEFLEGQSYKKILEQKACVIFIVLLDDGTNVDLVKRLCADFPETYPQWTRVKANEERLEEAFRFWTKPDSPSNGKFIVQKYDWYCGTLPDEKPCDLSPVEREPCWHLRRDMEILFNGDVPLCRECILQEDKNIIGNAFSQDLEEIWNKKNSVLNDHIQKTYSPLCGKCDEYYTFNF